MIELTALFIAFGFGFKAILAWLVLAVLVFLLTTGGLILEMLNDDDEAATRAEMKQEIKAGFPIVLAMSIAMPTVLIGFNLYYNFAPFLLRPAIRAVFEYSQK